jgi:hypothetical protein
MAFKSHSEHSRPNGYPGAAIRTNRKKKKKKREDKCKGDSKLEEDFSRRPTCSDRKK